MAKTMFISEILFVSLIETGTADAINHDVFGIDAAPVSDFIGKRDLVEKRPCKILNLTTLATDEMVMPAERCLKTGETFRGFHLLDQSRVCKGREGSVDRVQGNSGKYATETLMQGLRRGMIGRQQEFAVDLPALTGDLEAGFAAGRLKGGDFFL